MRERERRHRRRLKPTLRHAAAASEQFSETDRMLMLAGMGRWPGVAPGCGGYGPWPNSCTAPTRFANVRISWFTIRDIAEHAS